MRKARRQRSLVWSTNAFLPTTYSPSEATTIDFSEAPRISNPHRHDPKSKKATTAALPKSKPKTTDIKRTTIPERLKAASDTEPCRLSAFGGLRKALNSVRLRNLEQVGIELNRKGFPNQANHDSSSRPGGGWRGWRMGKLFGFG